MIDVEYINGNLVQIVKDADADVVAHGCNCFHIMGAGVAKQLNDLTDGALLMADMQTPYGNINKMGTNSFLNYECEFGTVLLVNMYTQYTLAAPECVAVHWQSFYDSMYSMISAMESGQTLAIPYIGCGLANGDIKDFKEVIDMIKNDEDLPDITITVVEYGK